MNRVALLACLVLAGCPKASAPTPPVVIKTSLSDAKPGETITATKRPPLELRGDVPGVMTIEQFEAKYSEKQIDWLPVPNALPSSRTASLTEKDLSPVTLASREVSFSYSFEHGVLESINVTANKPTDVPAIRKALEEKFGPSEKIFDDVYGWTDGKLRLGVYSYGVTLSDVSLEKQRRDSQLARDKKDL